MSVGAEIFPGINYPITIGSICIPSDLDRESYIYQCSLNKTVCVRSSDGAFYKNVYVGEGDFQRLSFPESLEKLGSTVSFISDIITGQNYITNVYGFAVNNTFLKEGEFKISKTHRTNVVDITGSAKDENLAITVNGKNKAGFSINVKSPLENGKFEITVQGDVDITASNSIRMNAEDLIEMTCLDEDGKEVGVFQSKSITKIFNNLIHFNNAEQAMVRGDDLIEWLKEFLQLLFESKVLTQYGLMPFDNNAEILKHGEKLKKIISTKSFLE